MKFVIYRLCKGRHISDLFLHRLCEKEGYRLWWYYKKGYPL